MAANNSYEFLQAIYEVAEEVGTIFAGHIPDSAWNEVVQRLLVVADSFEDHPMSDPLRMIVIGALAGIGHEDFD
jgi:hypothetical protein